MTKAHNRANASCSEDANTAASVEPAAQAGGNARRDLLVGLGAFALFVIGSLGALMILNRANTTQALPPGARSPSGRETIEIKLVHTNDTWGYLYGCG